MAMIYKFSRSSREKLHTCHPDLISILKLALSRSMVDFGVSEGFRSSIKQKEYFDAGVSKIDGINVIGKHNAIPSMAVDIFAYFGGASWDKSEMCYLAGVITSCARELLEAGEISHKIRWGGNWDNDGTIIKDQSFNDLCHFELTF